MKKYVILFLFAAVFSFAFTQKEKWVSPIEYADTSATVHWHSLEDAIRLNKQQKKKLFVSVYQSDCDWCQRMEAATFNDPVIANYLNENFYAVKFDIHYDKEINIGDKVYGTARKDGQTYHELADYFTMGTLGAPTSVFVDIDMDILQPFPGYKDPVSFEIIMTYYGENHYQNTPWSMYKESYVPFTRMSKD